VVTELFKIKIKQYENLNIRVGCSVFLSCIACVSFDVFLWIPLHSVIADIGNNGPPPLVVAMKVCCTVFHTSVLTCLQIVGRSTY
jgi:hypothetical protein